MMSDQPDTDSNPDSEPPDTLPERMPRESKRQGRRAVLFAMLYGGVMGSWGLFSASVTGADQWRALLYSALKVPLLLGVTFLLSLPVIIVLYTLAGLRADFRGASNAMLEVQGGLATILGSLAPITLLWYVSFAGYQTGLLFNALMFAIATVTAGMMLQGRLRALLQRNPRHGYLLRAWIVLYVFIGIQMGWSLRPFIGSPSSEVTFFRTDDLGNAYESIAEIILQALSH